MRVVLSNSRPGLIHKHACSFTHMCKYVLTHTQMCKHVYCVTHTSANRYTLSHILCKRVYSHTHVRKCILPHVCPNVYALTRVKACTLSVSDTSVQMYIISYTHTHVCSLTQKHTTNKLYNKPTPAQNLPFLRSKGSPSKQDPIKYLYRNDFVLSYRKDSPQCSSQSMV